MRKTKLTGGISALLAVAGISFSGSLHAQGEPELQVNLYGFAQANYVHADSAVLSFGRENQLAPNSAKRLVQFDDREGRGNISVNQTRLGVRPEFGNARGIVEFDFIGDYNRSSPNTGVHPRLRQAGLSYDVTENFELFAGQLWDIFGGSLNPGSYNATAVFLQAGNVGWIREQIGARWKGDGMQIAAAVGNTSLNTAPNPILNVEQNSSPTAALQFIIDAGPATKIHLSGIAASVRYSKPWIDPAFRNGDSLLTGITDDPAKMAIQLQNIDSPSSLRRQSSGVSAGFTSSLTDQISLSAQAYWGRNLANLHSLSRGGVQQRTVQSKIENSTLGIFAPVQAFAATQTRTDYDSVEEIGGWIFLSIDLTDQFNVGLMASGVQIQDDDRLSGAAVDLSRAQENVDVWGTAQMGAVQENRILGMSLTHKLNARFSLFTEYNHITTLYKDAERNQGFSGQY